MHLKSELLSKVPGLLHGFGTLEEPLPCIFSSEWKEKSPLWHQVHGVISAQVEYPHQECGEADALFTFVPAIPVAVVTADCVPILICDQGGNIVAAIHAGWKGIIAGIIPATIQAMDTQASKLMAWLGPAIGPNSFKAGQDVYEIFLNDHERL